MVEIEQEINILLWGAQGRATTQNDIKPISGDFGNTEMTLANT